MGGRSLLCVGLIPVECGPVAQMVTSQQSNVPYIAGRACTEPRVKRPRHDGVPSAGMAFHLILVPAHGQCDFLP